MRDYSKTWACDFPHLSGYLWVPKPEPWNSSSTAFLCELQQLVTKYFSFQLLKYLTCVFSSPPWSTSLGSWNDCNRVSCVLPSNFVSSPSTSSQNEFSMIFYIHWKLIVVSPYPETKSESINLHYKFTSTHFCSFSALCHCVWYSSHCEFQWF